MRAASIATNASSKTDMKKPTIVLDLPEVIQKRLAETDLKISSLLVEFNRNIFSIAKRATDPTDFNIGDFVIPDDENWMRGAGVVDEVDDLGRVWATYGPRMHFKAAANPFQPSPAEGSAPVRCYAFWNMLRIVQKSAS